MRPKELPCLGQIVHSNTYRCEYIQVLTCDDLRCNGFINYGLKPLKTDLKRQDRIKILETPNFNKKNTKCTQVRSLRLSTSGILGWVMSKRLFS